MANCVPTKFKSLTSDGETGCNFLCLPSPSHLKYECNCPTGVPNAKPLPKTRDKSSEFELTNQYICPEHPQQFLLIAKPPQILMLSLQVPALQSHLLPVGASPRRNPVRVDFDPMSKSIYWVDGAIYRLKLNETSMFICINPMFVT